MSKSYLTELKCKHCGKPMELVDVDYNFKGNQNEYWLCDDVCLTICKVKIRYGHICKYSWSKNV